jgi:hypothetical protein
MSLQSNPNYFRRTRMSKDKKEDRDMETPVVAQPCSFLEVLGYHRNPDGTLTGDGPPTHKEENEDE